MSGSRDTRESAEEAGTSAVPADAVPPSFGGAAPPADPPPADAEPATDAESAASDALRLPPFGLEAPWWAAESTETAPPGEGASPASGSAAPAESGSQSDSASDAESGPASGSVPPGTLVAGVGVPKVDSRGAVPADPIVKRALSSGDTDPDGFPAVSQEAPAEPAKAEETPETGTPEPADTAVDMPAVADEPGGNAPAAPGKSARDEQASAFEKARAAEDASIASAGEVLEPDAILPVGVTPPTGSGPFPQGAVAAGGAPADAEPGTASSGGADEDAETTAPQPAVIAPVYHVEGAVPLDTAPPPGQPPQSAAAAGPAKGGGPNRRRPLLIGGGAAIILAAGVALFTVGGTGSDSGRDGEATAVQAPATAQSTPPAAPATPSPTPSAAGPPSRIDNERTDREPLAFQDVFPTETIKLGGRTYTRDRWSLNREPSYAARGSMLQALEREKCRKIVRATFIERSTSLAVTSGIAVMPTKEAALRVSRAGDPARYEWFRGMGGKNTPNLDRAGGYAAATVRGRYVAYAYVQWANGQEARPGDPVIKQAAQRFLDYDLRPIMERARR